MDYACHNVTYANCNMDFPILALHFRDLGWAWARDLGLGLGLVKIEMNYTFESLLRSSTVGSSVISLGAIIFN